MLDDVLQSLLRAPVKGAAFGAGEKCLKRAQHRLDTLDALARHIADLQR
ncbi:hypothetical protein P6U16_17175 [Rhizobium sp. 32-5/1]|nr:hypothetical protein [Rhizobium sp. 32-5/1]WEZ82738.1 hypothetical protein P6U16_17175 [Rhizobium sp. 32-5/1]